MTPKGGENLSKIAATVMVVAMAMLALSTLSITAKAVSSEPCNHHGAHTAHEDGMPSDEPGEHWVPGLQHTPFAEAPGHEHVPCE